MDNSAVLTAAVKLFGAKGFAATGIRELGQAAGMSSAGLYHYYGDKEQILVRIIESCMDEFRDFADHALKVSSDPRIQIAAVISGHAGFTAVNPSSSRVTEYEMRALSPTNHDRLQGLRDDYDDIVNEIINRGKNQGFFAVEHVRLTRLAILEMCTGVAHWYRASGENTVSEIQDQFVNFGLRILGCEIPVELTLPQPLPPVQLAIEP